MLNLDVESCIKLTDGSKLYNYSDCFKSLFLFVKLNYYVVDFKCVILMRRLSMVLY